MIENTNDKQQKQLNKVRYFYINKVNKIRRITSQLMNKINNNTTLSNNIYTKEMHKIQQLDATFELLDSQLKDLKNTINYYEENEIEEKKINEKELDNNDNKLIQKNNLLKSDLDLLFPIMYLHLNSVF
jgi:hypothetical protein